MENVTLGFRYFTPNDFFSVPFCSCKCSLQFYSRCIFFSLFLTIMYFFMVGYLFASAWFCDLFWLYTLIAGYTFLESGSTYIPLLFTSRDDFVLMFERFVALPPVFQLLINKCCRLQIILKGFGRLTGRNPKPDCRRWAPMLHKFSLHAVHYIALSFLIFYFYSNTVSYTVCTILTKYTYLLNKVTFSL